MLGPGTVLKRGFVIERVLGQGGMGCVYLARQTTLGDRLVALKETVLTADPQARAQLIALLQREARILASLDHPGVVKVMDFFEEGDAHFFAMEYIDGSSLQDACEAGPVPIDKVLDWADQLCEILTWLHEHQPPVIVRDLKPANMLLNKAGRLRIIDFGIAGIQDGQAKTSTVLKGSGTVGYAPVEQFSTKGGTDHRSDIYALGGTLYTLLTCQVPPWSVDLATGDAQLIPPRRLSPKVSPELEAVILKMMALKRDDRYQSVAEARQALALARANSKVAAPATVSMLTDIPVSPEVSPPPTPAPAVPPAAPISKSNHLLKLGLAMVAVVGAVIFLPMLGRPNPPATPTPAVSNVTPTPASAGWDPQAELTECEKNLDTVAASLKQWSEQHKSYPERFAELPSLPTCPTTDLAYDYQSTGQAYTVSCSGDHSAAGVPVSYPLQSSSAGQVKTEPWLAATPQTALDYALRGRARSSLGHYQEASEDFKEAVRLDPSDAYSNSEGARARLELNDVDGASGLAYRAVVLEPENPEYYANVVEVQLGRDDMAQATKEIEKLAPQAGTPAALAEIARLRCLVLFCKLDFAKAEASTGSFAQENPAEAEYFRLLCALAKTDGAGIVEHGRNCLGHVGYRSSLSGLLCAYVALGYEISKKDREASDFLLTALPRLRGAWSAPAAQYAAGKINQDELLERAGSDLAHRLQARTLLGLFAAARGDRSKAREHLHWVTSQGQHWKTTYPLAKARLSKL